MSERSRPYGEWPSPITAEQVASGTIEFGHLTLAGKTIYWREQRPAADGQGVIMSHDGADMRSLSPAAHDVRTLVHQYGGGDFTVHDDVVFYARFATQRVYRQSPNTDPTPITPAPETDRGLRYADFEVHHSGQFLYSVRENHDIADEETQPVTTLVRIPTDGMSAPTVVASGHDFYAAPRLSPDGSQLAWLTWDHPRMPWDGTELHVASIADDGSLTNERVVMGGPTESVLQPAWRSDGTLHAVSDRTGWWSIYRHSGDSWQPYREDQTEYAVPPWVLGTATYAFLADGRIATVAIRDGRHELELLSPAGDRESVTLPFAVVGERGFPRLRSNGQSLWFVGSSPSRPSQLVRWTPDGMTVLRESSTTTVDSDHIATPDHVTVPTRDGDQTHAFVYPPHNPDVEPPTDDRPPALIVAHGGPTSAAVPTFDLSTQFFTSRGIAVVEVNYRGSTGYGRAYREALSGNWGQTDVTDCLDVATHLAADGRIDPDRTAIRGGSAGGFVALAALAFHDAMAAGTSYYGVADLGRLADRTHKFESRYLDQLIGPYPDLADTYQARSPVNHADGVDVPILLLQGEDDQVVPRSQAEAMVETLAANKIPHHLSVFEDEQHGFRRAESIQRAHELELAFYAEVFDIEPADAVPSISLSSDPDS